MANQFKFKTVPLTELVKKGLHPDENRPRPVVLVVDDEEVIADTLAAILNGSGFAATAAYDGESAMELARIIPPDLLVSDVVMPRMNGVDLAINIRTAVPDCRVLLFSGQAATVDLLSSARMRGYDFSVILKPIHPTDLLAKLNHLCGQPAASDKHVRREGNLPHPPTTEHLRRSTRDEL